MSGGKRASMREGPLAALFRRTDEDAPQRASRSSRSSGRTPPAGAAARLPAGPLRAAEEPEPQLPSPKERLSAAFSQDIPHNVMERPGEPSREYRPRDEPQISRVAVHQPVLRVVGVGGGGVNAVNRMVEAGVEGVEFIAVNTDVQSLQQSAAHVTLHIGSDITRGLGSGSDPKVGHAAAISDDDRIKTLLKGSDMVFVAAGSGGGTGTGAAPVVARIAREVGALTVGIVTKPFGFEGTRRARQADDGVDELAKHVDTLIVVPNNRLLSVLEKGTSMVDAFRVADDVLRQGVQGISDLVTLPGLINLDFADVRTIMSDAGQALLGIGMATGDKRAIAAAQEAVSSPLLETSIEGARSILLSITGGSRPLAVGGQRGRPGRVRGRAPEREHHLRRDGRREDLGRVLGHRRGDRLRRPARRGARRPAASPSRRASRASGATGVGPRRGLRDPRVRAAALTGSSSRTRPRLRLPRMKGVVAAGHPVTAEAGAQVLREGGNAFDAAVGAALASFVAESPLTSLGAGGSCSCTSRARATTCSTSSWRRAAAASIPPSAASWRRSRSCFDETPQVFNIGPASCGVPGTAAGLWEVARRFGTMPFGELAAPAVRYAREGVRVTPEQAYVFTILEPILCRYPETAELYAPEGRLLTDGRRLPVPRRSATRSRRSRRRGRACSTAASWRSGSATGCASAAACCRPRTSPRTR